jgi:hypothetical protein
MFSMPFLRHALGLSIGAGAAMATMAQVGQAQPAGLAYPQPGIVCDSVGQVCYDSFGPSIGITQETYGAGAADRLSRNLSQTTSRDFRLSTGQSCSVAQRTCWNDGWGQNQVAKGLTNQLFRRNDQQSNSGKQTAQDSGLCSLSRAAQRVYDGPCQMRQVRDGAQNRYVITLQNNNRYVFLQNGGQFTISDGFGGSWPATFVDHGQTGIFRFSDYKLVATQTGGSSAQTRNEAVGNALGVLLNSLFK